MNGFRKTYSVIFSIICAVALLVPSIGSGFPSNFVVGNFGEMGDCLEESISENFTGHAELIRMFNLFRIRAGDRVFPNVLVGRDGWFFYTGHYSTEDYQHTGALRTKKLEEIREHLDQLNMTLVDRGIVLIVVIAPNKQTIYPQYMPEEIPVFDAPSRLDLFFTYMYEKGVTRVIDLRPVLKQASQSEQVYYKTDTHWNQLGAYYAYQEIISTLSEYDSNVQIRPLADFDISLRKSSFDLSKIFGVSIVFSEDKVVLKAKTPLGLAKKNAPRVLIYHDSFFGALKPLLNPHFRMRVVNYNAKGVKWDLSHTEENLYDFVIIEVVERNFVDKILELFKTE